MQFAASFRPVTTDGYTPMTTSHEMANPTSGWPIIGPVEYSHNLIIDSIVLLLMVGTLWTKQYNFAIVVCLQHILIMLLIVTTQLTKSSNSLREDICDSFGIFCHMCVILVQLLMCYIRCFAIFAICNKNHFVINRQSTDSEFALRSQISHWLQVTWSLF